MIAATLKIDWCPMSFLEPPRLFDLFNECSTSDVVVYKLVHRFPLRQWILYLWSEAHFLVSRQYYTLNSLSACCTALNTEPENSPFTLSRLLLCGDQGLSVSGWEWDLVVGLQVLNQDALSRFCLRNAELLGFLFSRLPRLDADWC